MFQTTLTLLDQRTIAIVEQNQEDIERITNEITQTKNKRTTNMGKRENTIGKTKLVKMCGPQHVEKYRSTEKYFANAKVVSLCGSGFR